MRRRTVLASLASAAVPAASGCSTCGETWPGVGWRVTPTSLEPSGDGWVIEADVSVSFDFGVEHEGVYGATVAAFDDDGRMVGSQDLGNLTWTAVPEDARTETECGDHGTLLRGTSLRTEAFPRWVGLRYVDATEAAGKPRYAARYEGPADGGPNADRYRHVESAGGVGEEPTLPADVADRVEFSRRGAACGDYPTPRVGTDYGLSVGWVRQLPGERFHPVLVDASLSGEALRLDVGLRAWPRFPKLPCLGEGWEARIETETLPDVVEIRHLTPDGEVAESTSVQRKFPARINERTPG